VWSGRGREGVSKLLLGFSGVPGAPPHKHTQTHRKRERERKRESERSLQRNTHTHTHTHTVGHTHTHTHNTHTRTQTPHKQVALVGVSLQPDDAPPALVTAAKQYEKEEN
jgi:hypothetical protein